MSDRNGRADKQHQHQTTDAIGVILGANLKRLREKGPLDIAGLAKKAQLPESMLQRCEEHGDTMGFVALCWVARVLQASLDDLLRGAYTASLWPSRAPLPPSVNDQMDPVTALARNLKALRREQKLSQAEVIRLANMGRHFLRDLEKGTQEPTVKTLLVLCEALRVSPQTLVFDREKVERLSFDEQQLLPFAVRDNEDRKYLLLWLFGTMSLQEIAERYKTSRQSIHQHIKKALAELREFPVTAAQLVDAITKRVEERLTFDLRPAVKRDRRHAGPKKKASV